MRCHIIGTGPTALQLARRLGQSGWIVSCLDVERARVLDWAATPTDAILLIPGALDLAPLVRLLASLELGAAIVAGLDAGCDAPALLDAGCDAVAGEGLSPDAIEALLLRCLLLRRGWRSPRLDLGSLTIDLNTRQVSLGEQRLKLRPIEFRLLANLALRAGRIVLREELLALMYAEGEAPKPRTLDSIVAGLRCALMQPGLPQALVTRNGGFCLDIRRPPVNAVRGLVLASILPPADWDVTGFDWIFSAAPEAGNVQRLRKENPYAALVVVTRQDPGLLLREGADAILSPDAGADYVTALLKRLRPAPDAGKGRVTARDISLDLDAGVAACAGAPLPLTPSETGVLALLLARPGRVVSRSAVLERLYHDREPPGVATIDAHVRSLRRKLAFAGSEADVRLDREMDGYRLTAKQRAA